MEDVKRDDERHVSDISECYSTQQRHSKFHSSENFVKVATGFSQRSCHNGKTLDKLSVLSV